MLVVTVEIFPGGLRPRGGPSGRCASRTKASSVLQFTTESSQIVVASKSSDRHARARNRNRNRNLNLGPTERERMPYSQDPIEPVSTNSCDQDA